MKEIEIDGERFRMKADPPRRSMGRVPMVLAMAAMFAEIGSTSTGGGKQELALTTAELIRERKLIAEKKSRLTANQRRDVVWRFERMFEKVTTPTPPTHEQ